MNQARGALFLRIDAHLASHVALALIRHRKNLLREGIAEPDGFAELLEISLQIARERPEASGRDTVLSVSEDGLHERQLLSRSDVSRITGWSLRTIDRRIADGELPSTGKGRLRRVNRGDLEAFTRAA